MVPFPEEIVTSAERLMTGRILAIPLTYPLLIDQDKVIAITLEIPVESASKYDGVIVQYMFPV